MKLPLGQSTHFTLFQIGKFAGQAWQIPLENKGVDLGHEHIWLAALYVRGLLHIVQLLEGLSQTVGKVQPEQMPFGFR